jgi:plasmid stabilization system protein ParE
MIVEIDEAAEEELVKAVAWYDRQSSTAGDEFLDEFHRAVQRIAAFPTAWPKVSRHARRCRLHRFPYGVVYQLRKDVAVIFAVMHLQRKPGYWKNRLN